ncbi:MAG TPA: phosphoribosylanthranilate isomerase [Bryobacteraceae bacterium]|jgi:phosphoribosylanthranilate isomerase|nr:phosphoribosylanthranilate isomerase [Bryobacteraceae bacterium]
MMVKICGITNREDAQVAVEAGASAVGFNFYRESPRYISPTGASLIAAKIPATVWKVGIFVNETPETIAKIALDAGLDVAQLYGTAEARGIRVWRAIKATESLLAYIKDEAVEAVPANEPLWSHANDENAEAVLLDTPSDDLHGGTGTSFDWSRAKGLPKQIIIAGGLDATNVRLAIEQARPWGVDACSRLEKFPGVKDHDKVREFVKAALQS